MRSLSTTTARVLVAMLLILGTAGTTATAQDVDRDGDRFATRDGGWDAGWIGLLGLFGLAGLFRDRMRTYPTAGRDTALRSG
jgi:hypothetical protein